MRKTFEHSSAGPISICHIASGERWAGAEAQVATLVKALARRQDVCVCAVLLNEGRLAHELRTAGIEVGVFPRQQNSFVRTYARAFRFLRHRNVQVLHSHRYKENLLAVLLQMRLNHPLLVRTQHGNPESGGRKYRLVYALDRATAGRVAKVISVSSHLRKYLSTYLKPDQIAVIRNGVDLQDVRSSLSRTEARERLNIAADAPVVGILARLDPVKRHDLFLATVREISRDLNHARFVIAGTGAQQARIIELAASLGISDRVLFLGDRSDAYDVLCAMDVMLVTSDHEGLPMSVLESMALGTVVVSRKVGGMPEVIRNGIDGILVDSNDAATLASACVRLLRDAAYRGALAAAAREKISREFSADANAEQLVHLYRTVLSDGALPASLTAARPVVAGDRR